MLSAFSDKVDSLRMHSDNVSKLVRSNYDRKIALKTSFELFGSDKVSFIAIDGTESQDQHLDMLVFYAGSFGYTGKIEFDGSNLGCKYDEPSEADGSLSISAAVPLYEQDMTFVAGSVTEGGVETDSSKVPSSLMRLAEYYMAVKSLMDNQEIKVVILDRSLANDMGHLIWSVSEMLDNQRCILLGMNTPYGQIKSIDLDLARMLHPNRNLKIPVPRSHLAKYAAIDLLISKGGFSSIDDLLIELNSSHKDGKLQKDLDLFNDSMQFLQDRQGYTINSDVKNYWDKVFSASLALCKSIFGSTSDHPLIYTHMSSGNTDKKWITADDLDYLSLIMLYYLIRVAWEKRVLVIGLVKDISASEMTTTVVPILYYLGKINFKSLPNFNSDKMLLQTASLMDPQRMVSPWRTIEFDASFRTMIPVISDSNQGRPAIKGAYKNVVSAEKLVLKSYIQLWSSDEDKSVRSHVFSYDRPCYPQFDASGEVQVIHKDGRVLEKVSPILHFENDSSISHLVMNILYSMALEVIPECLGHNYPLFLADKKAKSSLQASKAAYLATVSFELARNNYDQQMLYEAKFRDFRSKIESKRRGK